MAQDATATRHTYARRNNFDLLRLVLAYAVVVYHVGYLTGHDEVAPGTLAGVAVGGFFVISGFLLSWSLSRDPTLGPYAIKRFFRIYPLYAIVMVVQAAVLVLEGGGTGLLRETARYLAANLAFLNFLQPTIGDSLSHLRMNVINGSAWTLKVEIACYVLLPVTLWLTRRLGLGFLLALALLLAASPILLTGIPGEAQARDYLTLASFFLAGSVMFHLGHHLDRLKRHFLVIGIVGTPLVLAGSPWVMAYPVLSQIVLAVWVYCFAFASRTITPKSDISYGAYLLHFPIIQIALLHGWLPAGVGASLACVVLVSALLAWLSFNYLESPMIRLGHRLARGGPARLPLPGGPSSIPPPGSPGD